MFGLVKLIKYLCSMKKNFLQPIANSIINGLENTKNDEFIKVYYDLGMWFDNLCINYFGVYLD